MLCSKATYRLVLPQFLKWLDISAIMQAAENPRIGVRWLQQLLIDSQKVDKFQFVKEITFDGGTQDSYYKVFASRCKNYNELVVMLSRTGTMLGDVLMLSFLEKLRLIFDFESQPRITDVQSLRIDFPKLKSFMFQGFLNLPLLNRIAKECPMLEEFDLNLHGLGLRDKPPAVAANMCTELVSKIRLFYSSTDSGTDQLFLELSQRPEFRPVDLQHMTDLFNRKEDPRFWEAVLRIPTLTTVYAGHISSSDLLKGLPNALRKLNVYHLFLTAGSKLKELEAALEKRKHVKISVSQVHAFKAGGQVTKAQWTKKRHFGTRKWASRWEFVLVPRWATHFTEECVCIYI